MRATFEHIDRRLIIGVHNPGSAEAPQSLRESIDWEFLPRMLAVDAVCQRHSWIEMSTARSSYIYSHHHTDSPAPADTLIVTLCPSAENYLSYDTVPEEDHDECPEELGDGLAHYMTNATTVLRADIVQSV